VTRVNTPQHSLIATYYFEADRPLAQVAEFLALQAHTHPTPLFLECAGSVHAVRETRPGCGEVDLAFPLTNLALEAAPYESLAMTLISGYAPAWLPLAKARLVDFQLPPEALQHFPGPRFGAQGIRTLLGAQPGELIVGTIVKPVAGLTPQEVAADVAESVLGGVRFIKDDQKMLNPAYCPLAERVARVMEAIHAAEAQTGRRALYAPNITTRLDRLVENAHVALRHGARALMINFVVSGFAALELLRRDPALDVPIYAHCGGKEFLTRAPGQGISPVVLAKWVRLAGGDILRLSAVGGDLLHSEPEAVRQLYQVMTQPWDGVNPLLPAASGALSPANLASTLDVCGQDLMVLAGRGIASHPLGVRAGTLAFQQAAEAHALGVPARDYAATHPELQLVL
jgi:ribulose-bisphosphate carboxylase large chain